jgi:phytoene desaturase
MLTVVENQRPQLAADDKRPHAIVIGSGFGGLAAAVRMGARGYRVTVLERLDEFGGRAGVIQQDGFTFDRGPTIVTAPHLFEELWTLCGKRMQDDVEMLRLKPFYKLRFDDGDMIACSDDSDAMEAEVRRVNADDLPGYRRFMKLSDEIMALGFEQLADQPFSTVTDMLRIAPDLLRLQGYRSVFGLVSAHVKHPKLRTMLSFHPLLIGGNPLSAPAIYCLIPSLERRWGVHYPQGGVSQIVDGLVKLIRGQGNLAVTRSEVAAITMTDGKVSGVRLSDGTRLDADIVISNADPAVTSALLPNGQRQAKRLVKSRYSMGLVVFYFGTKRRYDDVGHHTILLGPRYEGLLNDIFKRRPLTEDFSLYLHRPSASDPSVAPSGCDAFYALTPVPHLGADIDWQEATARRRDAIIERLSSTLLPGLRDEIVTETIAVPDDFAERYLSPYGSGFSLEPILTQSAWFRPHNRSDAAENLYLVGAGTHPGAGLPGVISSARMLDRMVPDAVAFKR